MVSDLEFNLAALVGAARARELVERLSSMGGTAYRIGSRGRADDDIERAAKLLSAGMTRAEIRGVLMDTRGLSRRTAYRRISAALIVGRK